MSSAFVEVPVMPVHTLAQHVHQIADQLPPEATWEDVLYQVQLHASIARGVAQAKAGESISADALLAQLHAQLHSSQ